jgi:hypothetical protein
VEVDWFLASLDAVESAAAEACEALAAVVEVLGPVRDDRLAGLPLAEIMERMARVGAPGVRTSAGLALQRYEQAVHAFRADVIRRLVSDEGLSISDAARLMLVSRQRAARIMSSTSTPAAPSLRDAREASGPALETSAS